MSAQSWEQFRNNLAPPMFQRYFEAVVKWKVMRSWHIAETSTASYYQFGLYALSTNYVNGLGIGKDELEEVNPHLRGGGVKNRLGTPRPQFTRPRVEPRTPRPQRLSSTRIAHTCRNIQEGEVIHSNKDCGIIVEHVSHEMRKTHSHCVHSCFTRTDQKGVDAPINLFLDLVELTSVTAKSVCDPTINCLQLTE
uniref:Uncharacterized protein n=1 Tax=Timema shepardi TaxID=629360 RepID=A0A7R9G0K9_TIMSH|nr:unnamed protein product [Timema shepardi]